MSKIKSKATPRDRVRKGQHRVPRSKSSTRTGDCGLRIKRRSPLDGRALHRCWHQPIPAGTASTIDTSDPVGTTCVIVGQADKAIAADHGNIYAYETKSIYLTITSRPAEALRVADEGLAINPNSALLLATRSTAETYSRQFQQAKLDIERAILLSPHDPQLPWFRNLSADAELGLGNIDAALDASRKAIDGGWRSWYSYLNLATASALKGDLDEAKSALAEARRLNPKLSIKFLSERKPVLQPWFDALRKAGVPEE
jgi:adenylate cyclase